MALTLTDPETEQLARELARRRGTSVDKAVRKALRTSLEAAPEGRSAGDIKEAIMEIARRSGALPRLTDQTPEEIIGYDEHGLPR